MHVLLVSQDRASSQLVAADLRRQGHSVVQACTSSESATRLAQTEVDVALLDSRLDRHTGVEVVRQLKQGHILALLIVMHEDAPRLETAVVHVIG